MPAPMLAMTTTMSYQKSSHVPSTLKLLKGTQLDVAASNMVSDASVPSIVQTSGRCLHKAMPAHKPLIPMRILRIR